MHCLVQDPNQESTTYACQFVSYPLSSTSAIICMFSSVSFPRTQQRDMLSRRIEQAAVWLLCGALTDRVTLPLCEVCINVEVWLANIIIGYNCINILNYKSLNIFSIWSMTNVLSFFLLRRLFIFLIFFNRTNTNERLNTRHFFTHKVLYMHLLHVRSRGYRIPCLTTQSFTPCLWAIRNSLRTCLVQVAFIF